MKKIYIVCITVVLIILVSIGVALTMNKNDETKPTEDQEISTTETTTTTIKNTSETEPSTVSLEDVSLSFPEEFIIEMDKEYSFKRNYRFIYYGINGGIVDNIVSVQKNEIFNWLEFELEYGKYSNQEPPEPMFFGVIKHFNITFKEFEQASKKLYLIRLKLNTNISNEDYEVPNPYILYTFNLKKINDYYSLDPERNASARKWLEEWLKTNKPYNSYSEYKSANP